MSALEIVTFILGPLGLLGSLVALLKLRPRRDYALEVAERSSHTVVRRGAGQVQIVGPHAVAIQAGGSVRIAQPGDVVQVDDAEDQLERAIERSAFAFARGVKTLEQHEADVARWLRDGPPVPLFPKPMKMDVVEE